MASDGIASLLDRGKGGHCDSGIGAANDLPVCRRLGPRVSVVSKGNAEVMAPPKNAAERHVNRSGSSRRGWPSPLCVWFGAEIKLDGEKFIITKAHA